MEQNDRLLLRAAQKIHKVLEGAQNNSIRPLPMERWRELGRAYARLRRAARSGRGTEDVLQNLRYRIGDLNDQLLQVAGSVIIRPPGQTCSLRSVYEDLKALGGEFDDFQIELRDKRLSAVTESIELEGIDLGRFKIELDWSKLQGHPAYRVIALDPNRAATNDSTTHPHVQDDALCEGEGRLAIRAALQQGRVLDFFVLVRQVLETYNPGSAYVALSDWSGTRCSDCATVATPDYSYSCDRCSSDLCSDCTRCCQACNQTNCSECNGICRGCDCDFCLNCLTVCNGCSEHFCSECLTDEQCSNCHTQTEEAEDEEPTLEIPDSQTGSEPAQPAIHAICLGEADVPA
jgi:hypothetical protein